MIRGEVLEKPTTEIPIRRRCPKCGKWRLSTRGIRFCPKCKAKSKAKPAPPLIMELVTTYGVLEGRG